MPLGGADFVVVRVGQPHLTMIKGNALFWVVVIKIRAGRPSFSFSLEGLAVFHEVDQYVLQYR